MMHYFKKCSRSPSSGAAEPESVISEKKYRHRPTPQSAITAQRTGAFLYL